MTIQEKLEKMRNFNPEIHTWKDKVKFTKEELELLSLEQLLEIAQSNGVFTGFLDHTANMEIRKRTGMDYWDLLEMEKRKEKWKNGGVIGAFLLKGGYAFTLRLTKEGVIEVPDGCQGLVIGKKGYRIKDIEKVTGRKVRIKTIPALKYKIKETSWNYYN